MSELTLYTKDGCPYCAAAKKYYGEQGRSFREINVHRTPGAKEELLKLSGGKMVVPVIVGDGETKVGFGGA